MLWSKDILHYVRIGLEGIVTFIQQGVPFREAGVKEEFKSIVVEVRTGHQSIRVINLYNPCKRLNKDLMENIGGEGNFKQVWCSDFNAHSIVFCGEIQIMIKMGMW